MTPRIILASSSPYRKALLARLGLQFETASPDIDETPIAGESFVDTALRLAREKARVISVNAPDAIVIGSDQVACCGDYRLDKPGNAANALEQLQRQRGNVSEFHTAMCVMASGGAKHFSDLVTIRVKFRGVEELTDARLKRYIELEQPFDCAGSAKSEGLGITLMESFTGTDPTALVGLPLITLSARLRQLGVDPLASD